MTGIGTFVVAVITVSFLSSSCVTSYPVGLRTSRQAGNKCDIPLKNYIDDFSLELPNLTCENVLRKYRNNTILSKFHINDTVYVMKFFYNKLNESDCGQSKSDRNVCLELNPTSCNKYKCLKKRVGGYTECLKTFLAMDLGKPATQKMNSIDNDYELLELFTCRVKEQLA